MSKRIESRVSKRYLHTHVHGSTIHSSQEAEVSPRTGKWINKMWSLHTMKHPSAIIVTEILTHVTIWMKHENTVLSEKSQSQKDEYYTIPLP